MSYQIYSQSDCAALHEDEIHYNNICAGIDGGYMGQCKDKFYRQVDFFFVVEIA